MRPGALLTAALLFLIPAASRADQYVIKGPFAVKKIIDGDTLAREAAKLDPREERELAEEFPGAEDECEEY